MGPNTRANSYHSRTLNSSSRRHMLKSWIPITPFPVAHSCWQSARSPSSHTTALNCGRTLALRWLALRFLTR